jgi:hypothetical protein
MIHLIGWDAQPFRHRETLENIKLHRKERRRDSLTVATVINVMTIDSHFSRLMSDHTLNRCVIQTRSNSLFRWSLWCCSRPSPTHTCPTNHSPQWTLNCQLPVDFCQRSRVRCKGSMDSHRMKALEKIAVESYSWPPAASHTESGSQRSEDPGIVVAMTWITCHLKTTINHQRSFPQIIQRNRSWSWRCRTSTDKL